MEVALPLRVLYLGSPRPSASVRHPLCHWGGAWGDFRISYIRACLPMALDAGKIVVLRTGTAYV